MTSNTAPKPARKCRPTVFVFGGDSDIATGFVQILAAAEPDDLAALDAAVEELLQFRAILAANLARRGKLPPGPAAGLRLVRPEPETAPGKVAPPTPPRSGASGPHLRERGRENRERIVPALRRSAGPLTVAEIAAATGLPAFAVRGQIDLHPTLFGATGSGKKGDPRRFVALPESPTPGA